MSAADLDYAKRDAELLDWLERTKASITHFTPGIQWNGVVKLGVEVEWEPRPRVYLSAEGKTLREAIEAALSVEAVLSCDK